MLHNVGQNTWDEEYENMLMQIKRADSLTVWVKKSEANVHAPEVFQIDDEKGTLLELETVRKHNGIPTAILLLIGLSSLLFVAWTRFPVVFNKLFPAGKSKT